ncbi:MAG: Rpn family recombination-promoting nuclease/putative transposase, partial [Spirochaetales bacterium]|nr:Rpn family recombination-promoting nuclease/putative transposase [Spirochaetales bacterium]
MGSDLALKDFVRYHLPGHIYQRIDPNSIQPTKQSYVPPELREIHSDLVCSCTIDRQEALLLLLVEHQSQESWLMPLRFIKYQAAATEDFLQGKAKETPWPIVVCACFYHGAVSPYPYS